MKCIIFFSLCLILFSAPQIASNTIRSLYNGNWSQSGIWDSNTVPGKNDDVIISQGDTVIMDLGLTNYLAVCHSLTVEGTLALGDEYYNDPATNLIVYGSLYIRSTGTIQPALDTTFNYNHSHSLWIGGDFSNYGIFVPSMSNSQYTAYTYITMTGTMRTIDAYHKTHIYSLVILKYTTLTGLLYCHSFELYSTFNNTDGILSIDNNGSVLLDSTASFAYQPMYGNNIYFQLGQFISSTASLPDTVYHLDFYGSLTLDKSITITNRINFKSMDNAYINTGNDTLSLGDNAQMFFNYFGHQYVVGNFAREFHTNDSLVFWVGTHAMDQARPIAIKLNNLPTEGTKITVTASDSLVKMNSLPQDLSAFEKYYFWEIKSSRSYSGNVDANVSLSFNDEYHSIGSLDYIHNYLAAAVLQGNQTTGQWSVVNNNLGISALSTISTVTAEVKSFGNFTIGQLYKIPNGNFEAWQYGEPYGWVVKESAFASGINQSDSAHSGSSAVQGAVVSGYNNAIVAPDMKFSIPFLQKLQAVNGYYRFSPTGGDKFFVNAKLYKDTNIVAEGTFLDSTSVSAYKEFSLNIQSLTKIAIDTVDSLSIEVSINPGNSNQYHIGSSFLIDDFSFGNITNVSTTKKSIPKRFKLYQNYPNPFNPTTNITFSISHRSHIILKIYDILGKVVKTLVNSDLNAGVHKIIWEAENYSSGVYFYQITDESINKTITKKMILLK